LKIASQKAVNIAEASHYEFLELFELGVENIPSRRENLIADFGETPFSLFQFFQ
jgi:hypothetical protein